MLLDFRRASKGAFRHQRGYGARKSLRDMREPSRRFG